MHEKSTFAENSIKIFMGNNEFIRQKGNYENLLCYKKAACVFDVTYYFAHKYLQRGDRTIDQMVQAARSGKQNIVEGLQPQPPRPKQKSNCST